MASEDVGDCGERVLGNLRRQGAFNDRTATISAKIEELMGAQKEAKKAREEIQKELKNEKRKRHRIMKKTKGLSNSDLVDILAERRSKSGRGVSPSPAEDEGGSGASGSGSASAKAA